MENKKSTYNAAVQKKYEQKRKKMTVVLFNEEYEKTVQHFHKKGFTSANSYLLDLIRKDLQEE